MTNREIKFRAWHLTKHIMSPGFDMMTEDGIIRIKNSICMMLECEGDSIILMQYTGLRDKNVKEIYEGDILRGTGIDGKVRVWEAVSLYYFHQWQETEDLIEEHKDIEVVGNIYEHPHLLEHGPQV